MSTNGAKPKLAMYWAASCGGCEIATLNIGEQLLTVDQVFDLAFFPCIADFKVSDVEGYPDGSIDLCLFNGAIRSSENEHMAHLLRRKSKILVAFGSCAYEGCIPALANLTSRQAILRAVYLENPSLDNPAGILPQTTTEVPEGELTLPAFYPTVKALDQVVDVDYYVPGCPPESEQIWAVLRAVVAALTEGAALPPKGSVVGAGQTAVCDECPLARHEKRIARFYRPYEIVPKPGLCLLEQGLVCLGPATLSGCGALCPQVGMGCRGCYGPLPGVIDQGARMLTAIASVIDVSGKPGDPEEALAQRVEEAVSTLVDPAGTFYYFSMAHSLLRRARVQDDGQGERHHETDHH